MANELLDRLKENERQQQEDAKKMNPTFGGISKSSLETEFVKQINQIERLSSEERQILLVAKTNASEKHLKSIRMNVLFFVWVFIISLILGVILVLNAK
ncbi:hypothetical protein ACILFS_01090 [Capnocytophaga canimorsus]|uniref:hypothetical protein n=1 Tax=Capnocytophaga TaxID=1016 RepID=UPI001561ECF5|nr:hypothetical protein [Capnocytophaga canis]